jgi:hypothetical protein
MPDRETGDRVPLERLQAMERQLFPMLPNNQLGRDLRSVVMEVLHIRAMEAADVRNG